MGGRIKPPTLGLPQGSSPPVAVSELLSVFNPELEFPPRSFPRPWPFIGGTLPPPPPTPPTRRLVYQDEEKTVWVIVERGEIPTATCRAARSGCHRSKCRPLRTGPNGLRCHRVTRRPDGHFDQSRRFPTLDRRPGTGALSSIEMFLRMPGITGIQPEAARPQPPERQLWLASQPRQLGTT